MSAAPDLGAVLPLLLLAGGVGVVLAVDTALAGRGRVLGRTVTDAWRSSLLALLATVALGAALLASLEGFALGAARSFEGLRAVEPGAGLVLFDRLGHFGAALCVAGALLIALASIDFVRELRLPAGPFYTLLLLATTGAVLSVAATDVVALFVGVELLALASCVQMGLCGAADAAATRRLAAARAQLRTGALATALLLFGLALVYGAGGETSYLGLRRGLAAADPLARGGLALLLAGLGMRLLVAPFHVGAAAVHGAAPLPSAALLSVVVRAALGVALLRFTALALAPLAPGPALAALAALSLLLGPAAALREADLKRLLAGLAVGQSGLLLAALAADSEAARAALLFQLLAFGFAGTGAYTCLMALTTDGAERVALDDLRGLARARPALAAALVLFALALAGLPGTLGFVALLGIVRGVLESGQVGLAAVAALSSLLAFLAVLRIPVRLYAGADESPAPDDATAPARGHGAAAGEWLVIVACAVATLLLGWLPDGAFQGAPAVLEAVVPRTLEHARDAAEALGPATR